MIKEKEILIDILSRNITYYKNKGYSCKNGETISIKIEDLNPTCKKEVTAICECGAEIKMRYEKYLSNKNRCGFYGCKKCSNKKRIILNQAKYGVDNTSQLGNVKEKREKTNIERFGEKTNLLTKETKEQIKKTNKNLYGVEYVLSSEIIRKKGKETLFKKWGVESYSKTDMFKSKMNEKSKNYISSILDKDNIIYTLDNDNNIIMKCAKNHDFTISYITYYRRKFTCKNTLCTICNPIDNNTVSDKENMIYEYIKENYNGIIIQSDREVLEGKELDIYLPDLNIAIEYNGVYWHSELYKERNYHLDKFLKCKEKGIHLIQIWEDDWFYKQDIVKSRLANILNFTTNKIFARKCVIKEVKYKNISKFLFDNHLQGEFKSKINLGLYYNNELVSVMTFGGLRKNLGSKKEDNVYEMLRFCNKLNYSIIGGASKLFKYFIKTYNPLKIISYANIDYSNGHLYTTLDFNFDKRTEPNYYWCKKIIRENRFKYRKDKLIKEGWDTNLRESDIMYKKGYFKIWDSGNLKFIFYNK